MPRLMVGGKVFPLELLPATMGGLILYLQEQTGSDLQELPFW